MKKVALLSVVFILIAVSVVPVMAAKPDNGHGNGVGAGQGNNGGKHDQESQQNQQGKTNQGLGKDGTHGGNRMRTPFYLQGTITGVFSDTITVEVTHSNATVKKFFSNTFTDTMTNTLTVKLSVTTQIFKIIQGGESEGSTEQTAQTGTTEDETPGNRVPFPASDLASGQKVAIHGNFVNGVFNATLITVYMKTALGEPVLEKLETP
jgi:hypothetical protein